MTSEQYLIVSYFAVGLLVLATALVVYVVLRPSFMGVVRASPSGHFAHILRKLFSLGIILPALFGFFSVSFRSCERDTYEEIIAQRAYLVAKNQEQLSTSFSHMVVALLIWGLIALGVLFVIKRHKGTRSS